MLQELTAGCGALIAGRRLIDQADGCDDSHPAGAPVVVATRRRPPAAAAKEIAAARFVTIAGAVNIEQALDVGLVDELCRSRVPVLFGSGIGHLGGPVMLDEPVVVEGVRAPHLRYPVRR